MIMQVHFCGSFWIDHFQTDFLDWACATSCVVWAKYRKSVLHLVKDLIEIRLDL